MQTKKLIPIDYLLTNKFCKRKLYLEEALGLRDEKKTIRKKILDEALMITNRVDEGIIRSFTGPTAPLKILEAYKNSASRALQEAIINNKAIITEAGLSIIELSKEVWSLMQKYIKMRAEHVHNFMIKERLYGAELWWELSPKINLKIRAESEKTGVEITIDRVDRYKNYSIPYVISRKNAPEEGIYYEHRIIIVAAITALAESGFTVPEGIIIYNNDKRKYTLKADDNQWLQHLVEKTIETLSSTIIPERINNEKICDKCSLREKCYDDEFLKKIKKAKETTLK